MAQKVDFLKDEVYKIFFGYLIPSIVASITVSMYILFDTIFIGRGVGSEGLAALNIAIPIYNVLFAVGLLLGIGGATAVSISIGRKKLNKVDEIFTNSIIVAIICSITFTILGSIFVKDICYFLGANENNIVLVKDYLSIVIMFSFSFLMVNTLSAFIRNDKAPKLVMYSTAIGAITNIIFDGLFVLVFHWGMRGAAIATVGSSLLSLFTLIYFHFIRGNSSLKLIRIKVKYKVLKRVVRNGTPSFIIEISSGIVIFAFNTVLNRIVGTIGVSAYSIIANISLICVAIFSGITQASQPIISINYGAKELVRVNKVLKMGVITATIFGAVFFMIGMLFPEYIVLLFNRDSAELISITVTGIKLYFIGFLFMGINIILGAYFQAIEFSTLSTVISMSRGIGFTLLGLIILPNILSLNGVWLTVPFAEILTLVTATMFFIKLKIALSIGNKHRSISR